MTQIVEFRVAMMCTCTHKGHYSTTRPRQTYTDSQSQIRSPQPNWSLLGAISPIMNLHGQQNALWKSGPVNISQWRQ